VDLSQPIGTILPPGMYDATIAEANVFDGEEALRLIVTFEILTEEGEVVSPERSWLTLAAIPASKAATQIREGHRNGRPAPVAQSAHTGLKHAVPQLGQPMSQENQLLRHLLKHLTSE
jgi:hypothetical protein